MRISSDLWFEMTLLFMVIGGTEPRRSVAIAFGTELVLSVVKILRTEPLLSVVITFLRSNNIFL